MTALFDSDLNPTDFTRPPGGTAPLGVTAPFQGTREGWAFGWLMAYKSGEYPAVPTLNKADDNACFRFVPACFGLAASVSLHVTESGDKHLYHEGRTIQLSEAVRRGLAWEVKQK